jgi:hypothetical protein
MFYEMITGQTVTDYFEKIGNKIKLYLTRGLFSGAFNCSDYNRQLHYALSIINRKEYG